MHASKGVEVRSKGAAKAGASSRIESGLSISASRFGGDHCGKRPAMLYHPIRWLFACWRARASQKETPIDGETPAWVISTLFHLLLLIAIAFVPILLPDDSITLTLTSSVSQEEVPFQEVHFDNEIPDRIGANSEDGFDASRSESPLLEDVSLVAAPDFDDPAVTDFDLDNLAQIPGGTNLNELMDVRGVAGIGVTGAPGAIDRITQEILLSLEQRKTLVVWLFDQSGSLDGQRKQIHDRLDRIYVELGAIEANRDPAFARHSNVPLLSSVIAFGQNITLRIQQPTADVEEIKRAVAGIQRDNSGAERVFSAIHMAADKFKSIRGSAARRNGPKRNVMFVVFTDEVGDDQEGLEATISLCREHEMPVYVVGVPAPFGRAETIVKWVDPDPGYDQSPQWGRVTQGPESLFPERIKLHFAGSRGEMNSLDSGFGPFSLTRLCYETGGIYFAVHPNRRVGRAVSRRETAKLSSYIEHFFAADVMRKYRPEYVSRQVYSQRLRSNATRAALVNAARMSWIEPMKSPRLTFPKRNDADLAKSLTEAQKSAAKLIPQINALFATLKKGEANRLHELAPRWQAGYDLAMGRILAVMVRTQAYNAMLAQAKRGMTFQEKQNDTWRIRPAEEIGVGSQMGNLADKAREYLNRVVEDHAGTPWALIAQRELQEPLGWQWTEIRTGVNPPPRNAGGGGGGGPARPPRDDQRRMINRPKPKRPPPKL